jgi:dCTP deaminase
MHPWEDENWLPGVLSDKQLKTLADKGYISNADTDGIDYSSLDLHLTNEGFQMLKGSIKPFGKNSYYKFLSDKKLNLAKPLDQDENGYFKLDKGNCYVFKLKEKLCNLSNTNIYGQATAKSSIGRLDVIARLIVDGMYMYETMDPDSLKTTSGEMYLEIMPISFNIKVKEKDSLSQLRLFYGKIDDAIVKDEYFIKEILHGSEDGLGFLSVNITNTNIGGLDVAAFKARKDVSEDSYINVDNTNKLNPWDCWSFDKADECKRLTITKNDFYIIRSKERISLPAGIAVYCKAMDESLGEMRIHYAGFVHPNFGKDRDDNLIGTPLIFEVRGHNVNVNLVNGERLAKLIFYRMSEVANKTNDNLYNTQELKLSKLFNDWSDKLEFINENNGTVQPYKK